MSNQNWMKKAIFLGFVFFLAAFLVKPVGVSTQFSVLSGMIHSTIDPEVITEDDSSSTGYSSTNAYYDKDNGKIAEHIKNPLNYEFVFVLAIPLGGWFGYLIQKKRKGGKANQDVMENQSCDRAGADQGSTNGVIRFIKRYLPAFLGGFLLLYGARMADGCTSGHMMSGMMQGSVSGYLFAGAVFLVAIPTAILIGNRRAKKGDR